MRDVLLAVLMAGLIPATFFRLEIGAYLWAWVSIMNPHQLAYGFARTVPWAQMIAVVTMVAYVANNSRKPLPINGGTVALILLLAWMTLTSAFALNLSALVWDRWFFAFKIFVMLLLTLMILRGRRQIDMLIWVLVVSVGFYGVKGGVWTVLTGGGGRVWGPAGGMIADNNSLAVALLVIVPFAYYLQQTARQKWVRWALLSAIVAMAFAIVGSHSRGALLGLLAMALFLGAKGKHPIRTSVLLLVLTASAVAFMPENWSQRMGTIQTYEGDSSAMSRVYTWQTLWNAAIDRPLVGAGFRADAHVVFERYASPAGLEALAGRVFVAHSIFFQALGEHGFVGLGLYLYLGWWTWREATRLGREAQHRSELREWVPTLMRMCQVALIGFAVGGSFLSLMLLDLPYYICALVVLTRCAVDDSPGAREERVRRST